MADTDGRLRIAHLLELTAWVALVAATLRHSVWLLVAVLPPAVFFRFLLIDVCRDARRRAAGMGLAVTLGVLAGIVFTLPAQVVGWSESPGDAQGAFLAISLLALWVGTAVGIGYRAFGFMLANQELHSGESR